MKPNQTSRAPDWEALRRKYGCEFIDIDDNSTAVSSHIECVESGAKIIDGKPAQPRLIISSKDFVADFVPPDYVIDDLLQRGYIYSLTGATGSGKTCLLLAIAMEVALGGTLGCHRAEKGRVLYFAGENPDDIRTRWIAMSLECGFDPDTICVDFIPGVHNISEIETRVRKEINELDGVALVIVDTSAAYFGADPANKDENDNVQMGKHARKLRRLTQMPGNPCVVVACHPAKNVRNKYDLIPRGGGAFLAEIDGNLTCWNPRGVPIGFLGCHDKFRGVRFDPIPFTTQVVRSNKLLDRRGRPIPSVFAKFLTEAEFSHAKAEDRDDENEVLFAYSKFPSVSYRKIARKLGWKTKSGSDNGQRVARAVEKLKEKNLLGEKCLLTDAGQEKIAALAN